MKHGREAFMLVTALLMPVAGNAQLPRETRALITVVDPSGAVLPGASVSLTGFEDATRSGAALTVTTNDKGLATIGSLRPGRYDIAAQFAGFDDGLLKDVRFRTGDNRHVIALALTRIEQSVTVSRDATAAAADPNGGSLATQLTPDEISALSDDPDELARQLMDLAGGNAVIKIDSFVGGTLPPKAFIKSIRVVRDTFPAENHSAEYDHIDIITQAGVGLLRGGLSSRIRDGAMSGRNPFVDLRAPERTQSFDANVGGTIVPNKSSFSAFVSRREQFDTPVATFTTSAGKQSLLLGRRPNDGWSGQGTLDYALTKDQTLRVSFHRNTSRRHNSGIGGFDLAERAYSSQSSNNEFRMQEAGPLGRRSFLTTRLEVQWNRSSSQSVVEAPTVRVLDGVTTGGAQVAGGRAQRDFEFATDLNYARGNHTMRTGVQLEGGHSRADNASNYLGTFVFSSTADFLAGKPRNYTRRLGDPLIVYSALEAGIYIQDDLKLRPNLTFSPGLRYEAQTHVSDRSGFAPRLGLTWAPGRDGRTTIRTSFGVFYNWLGSNVYEQTLRVNGFRQQELNIVNPTYPDPGVAGTVTATNKYVIDPDVRMDRYVRFSAAVDRTISPKLRFSLAYAISRSGQQLRGKNLNPPIGGVRPDPTFANVIQVVSDASTHSYNVIPDVNVNFAGGDRTANQARWNPRRTVVRFNYRYSRLYNNSDGAFNPPPSGSLADQWAPAQGDTRHRLRASVSTQALRNFNAQISVDGNSGSPYSITTGFDDNGDSIFNDRPVATPRNSLRLPWRQTLSANFSYMVRLGAAPPPDGGGNGPRGGRSKGITFNVSIQNLTNRANYTGFSGVMTSAYFLQATSVANPRQIDLSLRFGF
ncbi:MAG: carboxypeptidase regulatory-like domain-containing protein [Vicinamibacterales bacterium]